MPKRRSGPMSDEEFEQLKEELNKPRKSYADMTDEEVEQRFRELGLAPPAPLRKVRG